MDRRRMARWRRAESGDGSFGNDPGVTKGGHPTPDRFLPWGAAFFCLGLSTVLAWERRQYASRDTPVSSRTIVPRNGCQKRAAQAHQVGRCQLQLQTTPAG